jgi:hypothetical protein
MTLSGAGLGMGIARGGLGMAGSAISTVARPLASSSVGRAMGAGALFRAGAGLKNIKIGDKSYTDSQKKKEEETKKMYDAITETKQGRWETNDEFSARKKRNQARGYGYLGISADRKTGLPKMVIGKDGKAKLKQSVLGISAAKKSIRSSKDISEESVKKKQFEALFKKEQDDYDAAKDQLIQLSTAKNKDPAAINAKRREVKDLKEALAIKKYQVGATDSIASHLQGRADSIT